MNRQRIYAEVQMIKTDLLDGQDLSRLLVQGFEHGPVAPLAELAQDVENLLWLPSE